MMSAAATEMLNDSTKPIAMRIHHQQQHKVTPDGQQHLRTKP
jgi:hypothetical protein